MRVESNKKAINAESLQRSAVIFSFSLQAGLSALYFTGAERGTGVSDSVGMLAPNRAACIISAGAKCKIFVF